MKQESVLSKINNPEAIRELKPEDLLLLAGALRQEIIDVIERKKKEGEIELDWDLGERKYSDDS